MNGQYPEQAEDIPKEIHSALEAVRHRLMKLEPVTLAVSGGLDSRLLSSLAAGLDRGRGLNARALFFRGPQLTPDEVRRAHTWLRGLGLPFRILDVGPLDDDQAVTNGPDRCYHCKRRMFTEAAAVAGARTLADGTNASDMDTHRPGLKALAELNVRSPLAEAGVTKDMVRDMARAVGMDDPDQPSRPCLLTRLAYGMRPDADLLGRLGRAEDALWALGLRRFRVRLPERGAAVVQVAEAERGAWEACADQALDAVTAHGLPEAEVDFVEEVSGYYDRREGLA